MALRFCQLIWYCSEIRITFVPKFMFQVFTFHVSDLSEKTDSFDDRNPFTCFLTLWTETIAFTFVLDSQV